MHQAAHDLPAWLDISVLLRLPQRHCRPAAAAQRASIPARKSLAPAAASARPAGTPKAVTFAAQSAANGPASHRLSIGGAAGTPHAAGAAAAAAAAAAPEPLPADEEMLPARDGYDAADDAEPMQEEGSLAGAIAAHVPAGVARHEDQQHAEPAAAAAQQEGHTPRSGEAAAAGQPGAGDAPGKTPWRTPAPVFNEAKTPATAGPATGWQLMYEEEEGAAAAGARGRARVQLGVLSGQPACMPTRPHARPHRGTSFILFA